MNINFAPKSIATNIYEGEPCPGNQYKFVVKDENENQFYYDLQCQEINSIDKASFFTNDNSIHGVILYTFDINMSVTNCNKTIIYVKRELIGYDKTFHKLANSGFKKENLKNLSGLINKKLSIMEGFYNDNEISLEEWQQLYQVETIKFLIEKLRSGKASKYAEYLNRLNSIEEKYKNLSEGVGQSHHAQQQDIAHQLADEEKVI
uniref:Uncharacterized protein n=1 Tax=Meloidogyne hapla TaxID=6305 RepID=A0A1I8BJ12_MELHA